MRASNYSPALLLTGLGVSAGAEAREFDLYGRLNVTAQNSDEAAGERQEVRNNASRLGVKGEYPLAPGLAAIYQLEFGVNIDGDADEDTFTPRNQFVGLEGAFGTIKLGRHDTALKEAQGDFDLFDDLEGDIAGVFNGENRLRDYLGYRSPTLGRGLHVTVNFFPGDEPRAGEGDDDEGTADGTSVSLDYESDTLYVALAHDRHLDGADIETTRLVAGHEWDAVQLMLLYQRTDAGAGGHDGFGASLAWTLGRYIAKFQYLEADQWRTALPAELYEEWYESSWSAGLDRELGDDTRLFGFVTQGDIGRTGQRNRYVAVGIEHDF